MCKFSLRGLMNYSFNRHSSKKEIINLIKMKWFYKLQEFSMSNKCVINWVSYFSIFNTVYSGLLSQL